MSVCHAHQLLHGRSETPNTGQVYDDSMMREIKEFQLAHGLTPDVARSAGFCTERALESSMNRWLSPKYTGIASETRLDRLRSFHWPLVSGSSEWRLRANMNPKSLRGPPPFGSKWQDWHISPCRAA